MRREQQLADCYTSDSNPDSHADSDCHAHSDRHADSDRHPDSGIRGRFQRGRCQLPNAARLGSDE
jgi:hypothetical protein